MGITQPHITLSHVTRSYDGVTPAVDAVSLEIPAGVLLALLGPSGCGKTTTLRLVAGLEVPDQGEISVAGRKVAGPGAWVPPEARRVGLVFQDGALFPHLTVADNIAFGMHRASKADQQRRVREMLETVGLGDYGARYPHQLSGGQQQRVALARALAPEPPVMLLDEPFANLDAALRRELRAEVERIVRAARTTTVFVTHDQEEALSTADLVAVMEQGRIAQLGTPQQIYEHPASRSVAAFVGEANFLPGSASGMVADCALGRVELATSARGPVTLLIRPEQLAVALNPTGDAVVAQTTYYGHDQLFGLRLPDGTELTARDRPQTQLRAGMCVQVTVRAPLVAFAEEMRSE
jgi:iron(III) transport system ATP-binding protein